MITCKEIRKLLNKYTDKRLDEKNVSLVEKHVSKCEFCRKEVDEIRELKTELKELRKSESPEDKEFLEVLHKRIKNRGN